MKMEGTLWKWTNYFSGWQGRWFVLDNGLLSYYRSADDVNNGCKGSVNMSVCDVVVHATDQTRLDLIIPGEQHFYLKALSPQERQHWLVALGTCKACLTTERTWFESGEMSPDIIRTKKSELRLYCDLLMQQVHSVKSAVTDTNIPDSKKLDEATSLLTATCDTFIKTLEDCMMIANANISPNIPHQHVVPSSPTPHSIARKLNKSPVYRSNSSDSHFFPSIHRPHSGSSLRSQRSSRSRSTSETSEQSPTQSGDHSNTSPRWSGDHTNTSPRWSESASPQLSGDHADVSHKFNAQNSPTSPPMSRTGAGDMVTMDTSLSNNNSLNVGEAGDVAGDDDNFLDTRLPTFFSKMSHSFMDIKLDTDGGIPVVPFLDSCRSLVPIFDKLNSTAFAPVKMDFRGNIKKIEQKYTANPDTFTTLQIIVFHEVDAKQYHLSSSATVALLWMKRSLEFILNYLHEVVSGEHDMSVAAMTAYNDSLKPFHSWVVKGVFGLAVKAIPARSDFISRFAMAEGDADMPDFERSLIEDLEDYITALSVVVRILCDFFTANDLDSPDQV